MADLEPLFADIIDDDVFDFEIVEYIPDLEKKLKAANVKYRIDFPEEDEPELLVDVPTESGVRTLRVQTVEECKMLLGSNFHDFHALNNLKGIFSRQEKMIECSILPIHSRDAGFIRRNARRMIEGPITLRDPDNSAVSITIGRISKNLAAIDLHDGERISFRIDGVEIHGRSPEEVITTYANSLFFQMEMFGKLPYVLERYSSGRATKRKPKGGEVTFPTVAFEQGPMALYWYARSAVQLPLLKFLAYYQCVEYFFPRLSRLAAHKKVQSLLKDPTFRATNDLDIERVFKAIKLTSSGRLGDEKSQLVSVIKECLHPRELIEFIESDNVRKEYLSGSSKGGFRSIKSR